MERTPRADIVLDEIERWRAEGILEEEEYHFLHDRYHAAAQRDRLRARERERAARAHGAGYATHVVGGLLLGAAIVALLHFFAPEGPARPIAALALGALAASAAHAIERRHGDLSAEALVATGLVAFASVGFYADAPWQLGALAAALVFATSYLRGARTPLALLALGAFFLSARHAAQADLMLGARGLEEAALLGLLAAYGALLVTQRRAPWGSRALGAMALAMALAAFPLLDALGVTDPGIAALGIGTLLGILFAVGIRLDERPLVAVTSGAITAAAVAFAFLALGPALAAIVLLLLGALLVWQAEAVKGYFGAPRSPDMAAARIEP